MSAAQQILMHSKSFLRHRNGSPAVEFALLLPMLILLYIGIAQISTAYQTLSRISSIELAMGDLIGRSRTLNGAQIDDIFEASELIMAPFSAVPLTITIRAIEIDGSGRGNILWTRRSDGATASQAPIDNLPSGYGTERQIVEVTTNYLFNFNLLFASAGPIEMGGSAYIVPRAVDLANWNGG